MNENTTNNVKEEKKKGLYIEVLETEKFEPLMSTQLITSHDLSRKINSLFQSVFKDYHGCKIMCNDGVSYSRVISSRVSDPAVTAGLNADGLIADIPAGLLYLNLFFSPSKDNDAPYRALEEIGQSGDMMSKLQRVYGYNSRRYVMTADAMELLTPYMPNPKRPNFGNHVFEITEQSMMGQYDILVKVSGINLDKIISKMYGSDKDYMCSFSNIAIASNVEDPVIALNAADPENANEMARKLNVAGIRPASYVSC